METSLFPRDWLAELDSLQRQLNRAVEFSPSIRGFARGGYPAVNVGRTKDAAEVFAFAPGLEPDSIEVTLERGVLSISGERRNQTDTAGGRSSLHVNERFAGRFHRVITLSDDLDPNGVEANYRNGLLRVTIKRNAAAHPRRVAIN